MTWARFFLIIGGCLIGGFGLGALLAATFLDNRIHPRPAG